MEKDEWVNSMHLHERIIRANNYDYGNLIKSIVND
jgi:hypothetical protein